MAGVGRRSSWGCGGEAGYFLRILFLFLSFVCISATSKINNIPCPSESDTVCIKCECDGLKGFSTCRPMKTCPYPITKKKDIIRKKGSENCPFTTKFIAECVDCECSGNGGDNCSLCFALPAKRKGQPEFVNNELPPPIENRLIQYEVNGWKAADDQES